jgi:hypothetical protein
MSRKTVAKNETEAAGATRQFDCGGQFTIVMRPDFFEEVAGHVRTPRALSLAERSARHCNWRSIFGSIERHSALSPNTTDYSLSWKTRSADLADG